MGVLRSFWTLVVLLAFALGSGGCAVGEIEVESGAEDREEHLLQRRSGKIQLVRVRPRREQDSQAVGSSSPDDGASALAAVAPGPRAGELTGAVITRLAPYHAHAPERIEFEVYLSRRSRGPPLSSVS